jgi:hypothetical protein
MRATPILTAVFIAAGCTFAFAQTGGGTGAGAAAGTGGAGVDAGAGTGTGAGTGAGGTSAGATAGAAQGSSTGIGGDTRPRRSPLTGVYRRGDDMAPLIIPQEEAPVRLRTYRQW